MTSFNGFGIRSSGAPKISEQIVSSTLNAVQKWLPVARIEQMCHEVGYVWRDRILTPPVIVLHLILSALWPEESFDAGWQVQWAAVAGRHPERAGQSPSRGTVSKARKRLPLALWEALGRYVSERAQAVAEPFASWRGHRVVLLDGTCVSMPEEAGLFEAFGTNVGYHGQGRYPLARAATLCLAGTMTVIAYALGGYRQSEWALALTIFGALRTGDLLVADRYFAAAHFCWRYQSLGLEFLTRTHQRLIVSRIKRIQSYSRNDFLGRLAINKTYRRQDPHLPASLLVRFLRTTVRIRGERQTIWLVTSLLDDRRYPAAEVVAVYARRWRIETLFERFKIHLSADVLRSRSAEGIRKEFAARCIALNLIHAVILEAAGPDHVDPLRISFVHAIRAILIFSAPLADAPIASLPQIYGAMLAEIVSHRVPARPGREEPRAIRREYKHYPVLRQTRAEWRSRHAA
jgi:hypothetical protein